MYTFRYRYHRWTGSISKRVKQRRRKNWTQTNQARSRASRALLYSNQTIGWMWFYLNYIVIITLIVMIFILPIRTSIVWFILNWCRRNDNRNQEKKKKLILFDQFVYYIPLRHLFFSFFLSFLSLWFIFVTYHKKVRVTFRDNESIV